jgi:hypothetical protein
MLSILFLLAMVGLIVFGIRRMTYTMSETSSPPRPAHLDTQAMLPVALGLRSRWLVVTTYEEEKLVEQLRLNHIKRMMWRATLPYVTRDCVFVTPSIDNRTVVFGLGLPAPDSEAHVEQIRQLVKRLSAEFGEAQYFCVEASTGMHCWAKAKNGNLVRLHKMESTLPTIDEGVADPVEANLQSGYTAKQAANAEPNPMLRDELVLEIADSWGIKFRALGNRMDAVGKLGWIGLP